jgi:lysophospholipase L1-like esterase
MQRFSECTTTIIGSEVLVIGESFIAMSHEITRNLEQLAKNAGILPSNESFRDNSVSGTRLSGGSSPTIPEQYRNAAQQSPVKWVIMDGGGNDCLQGSCSTPPTADCPDLQNAVTAARNLLAQMGNDGVVKVIYFFYPEPQADFGGLKAKLDVLRPLIQNVVNSSTNPVCYWLDLRPVFEGHYSEYINADGIHPSSAGCQATANAIWDIIQRNNFFGPN